MGVKFYKWKETVIKKTEQVILVPFFLAENEIFPIWKESFHVLFLSAAGLFPFRALGKIKLSLAVLATPCYQIGSGIVQGFQKDVVSHRPVAHLPQPDKFGRDLV